MATSQSHFQADSTLACPLCGQQIEALADVAALKRSDHGPGHDFLMTHGRLDQALSRSM